MVKCIRKIRNSSNVITDYILTDSYRTVTMSANDLKQRIQSGQLVVSNLTLTSDYRLIDSNEKDNILEKYYENCQLFGITPLKIEKVGEDYIVTGIPQGDNLVIPNFVTGFKVFHRRKDNFEVSNMNNKPVNVVENTAQLNEIHKTEQEQTQGIKELKELSTRTHQTELEQTLGIKELKRMAISTQAQLSSIQENMGIGFNSVTDRLEKLQSQSANIQNGLDYIRKINNYGFVDREGNFRDYSFPKLWTDIHGEDAFNYDNAYETEEKFLKSCAKNKNPYIALTYDKPVIQELYNHLILVNDARGFMESCFEREVNSEMAQKLMEQDSQVLSGIASTSLALLYATHPGLALGSLVTKTIKTGVMALNTGGGKVPIRGEYITWKRHRDGFMTNKDYISVDRTKLTADREAHEQYAADIRVFVVDMRSCGYRRGIRDKNKIDRRYRHKPYYKYVEGTMGRCPVDDERLFNFFCELYLKRARGFRGESKDGFFDSDYFYADLGIKAVREYFNVFVNAYFAVVKYYGYQGLDFLYNCDHNLTTEEKKTYYNMLYLIKMCLIIQGCNDDFADYLIAEFVKVDLNMSKRESLDYFRY